MIAVMVSRYFLYILLEPFAGREQMNKKTYEIDMTEGPILGKMLKFALPLMLSSVLQLLFNAADVIVVGRFAGENSLAAVGATGALINLLTNLFIGLSVGANVMVARHFGAKEKRELSDTVHTAMLLSIISGIVLTIVGEVFAGAILEMMQTPGDVLGLAALYLRTYFIGMPAMMVYNFGSAILRAVGDTKRPLYFLVIAGVVNVILNLIFVIVLKMDVAGVGIATAVSQTFSAVMIVICLIKENADYKLELRKLKIHMERLKGIMKVGIPAGLQGTIFSLSNVVIQSSVNTFGETVVAGNSAAANIEGFVYMAMNSFHHATLSFTSQNMGAGKIKRITRILFTGIACTVVTGVVLGLSAVIFDRQLLGIYSDSKAVIDAGTLRIEIICTTYALCGIMDVMVGGLRGLGYAIMPMIVSLLGACGIRLLWIATIFTIPQFHSIKTVYMSYPVSWAITVAAHVICYIIVRKKMAKKRFLTV